MALPPQPHRPPPHFSHPEHVLTYTLSLPVQDLVNSWLSDACQAGARIITGAGPGVWTGGCWPSAGVTAGALAACWWLAGRGCRRPGRLSAWLLPCLPSCACSRVRAGAWAERVLLEACSVVSPTSDDTDKGHVRRRRAVGVLVLAGSSASPLRLAIQVRAAGHLSTRPGGAPLGQCAGLTCPVCLRVASRSCAAVGACQLAAHPGGTLWAEPTACEVQWLTDDCCQSSKQKAFQNCGEPKPKPHPLAFSPSSSLAAARRPSSSPPPAACTAPRCCSAAG